MKFKKKLLKNAMATLCASAIAVSGLVTSVGAIGTRDAEVKFALKHLDMLPKKGENFEECLTLPTLDSLNEFRKMNVMIYDLDSPDRFRKEIVDLPEKTKFAEIQQIIKTIEGEVDKGETGNLAFAGIYNKKLDMPRQMRIANAIYSWIATNINYDDLSENVLRPKRMEINSQDALAVYVNKTGVCAGKTALTQLMMRMAKIPCVGVGTNFTEGGESHAFNAIYLDDSNHGREGWTLVDSTWGIGDHKQEFFPAFYNTQKSFSELNKDIMDNKPIHIVAAINFEMDSEGRPSKQLDFNIDGVKHRLCGTVGNSCIELTGANGQIKEIFSILPDIANLNLSFKIGPHIKTFILKGDEKISDLSEAMDIENINTKNSNKYVFIREDGPRGTLYTKDEYFSKLKEVDLENKRKQYVDFTLQHRQNAVNCYNNEDDNNFNLLSYDDNGNNNEDDNNFNLLSYDDNGNNNENNNNKQ